MLFFALVLFCSCKSYDNPPFVVVEIGKCHENGMTNYLSKEYNMVLTYCGKYQIGDTIPNVSNYTLR